MNTLNHKIRAELLRLGADVIGFGNITELPDEVRAGMPIGISVAVAYPKEIIRGIAELPTQQYREWYDKLNDRLDIIVARGAEMLCEMGFTAIAQTRELVGDGENEDNTALPHKTIATRAGIGWIGKSALLATKEYGSAIRLSSILTDAPLAVNMPINKSNCGECMVCTNACPAGAISGKMWEVGLHRDEFFDPVKCRTAARERAQRSINEDITICGKCIEACPNTQQYINPRKQKTNIY